LTRGPALRLALVLLATAQGGCGDSETALLRGDRFWADSNYTSALAEYRLAMGQREMPEARARVAHAYIKTGQFERAREAYDRLLRDGSQYVDQAIMDYVTAARQARNRSDRYGMAVAVEAALALRPGLPLDDMAAPLARYYASTGDGDRALDFFERALGSVPPDSVPDLLFEIGELHDDRGTCEEAIGFFEAYLDRAPDAPRVDEARWHLGECAFQLGRQARQRGELEKAVEYLDKAVQLGVPQSLQDQAWFERGEAFLEQGNRDEALRSYRRVLELNRMGTGQLVERAQQRIDQIRFGRIIGR
jgi:tetratricopeptide (TPR) repeat protein